MVREVLKRSGDTLDSSDFVKMYVNYKPVYGLSMDDLRDAFSMFAYPMNGSEIAMTREKFLSILLDKGKPLTALSRTTVRR